MSTKLDPCQRAVGRFMFTTPFSRDQDAEALMDRSGNILCLIAWDDKWRCYVARSWAYSAVMSAECLLSLNVYLDKRTKARIDEAVSR